MIVMLLKNVYTPDLLSVDLGYYPSWDDCYKKFSDRWVMNGEGNCITSMTDACDGNGPLHHAMVGAIGDFAKYAANADEPRLQTSTAELSVFHEQNGVDGVLGVDVCLAVCGGVEYDDIVVRCDIGELLDEWIDSVSGTLDYDEPEFANNAAITVQEVRSELLKRIEMLDAVLVKTKKT